MTIGSPRRPRCPKMWCVGPVGADLRAGQSKPYDMEGVEYP